MQYSSLISPIIELAVNAGDILMKHYKSGVEVEVKDDNSPVTVADREADDYISQGLHKLGTGIPVISEEGDLENLPHTTTYWLVDPLDGTRSFIKGEPEFTVNIGLIIDGRAKIGVIYAPALGELFYTGIDGKAYKKIVGPEGSGERSITVPRAISSSAEIKVSKVFDADGFRVIASKNHRNKLTEEYIQKLKVKEFVGSASSYKFCLVAEGKADIYPRFSNTMQWDTAAGQAILEAAGGKMMRADGSEFTYRFDNKDPETLRNSHFVARNF